LDITDNSDIITRHQRRDVFKLLQLTLKVFIGIPHVLNEVDYAFYTRKGFCIPVIPRHNRKEP